VKKKDVEKGLKTAGWWKDREGKSHEVWVNGQGQMTTLPRHSEINENTARSILKLATQNPG